MLTPAQATRHSRFMKAVTQFKSDGSFITTFKLSVDDEINISFDETRVAVVTRVDLLSTGYQHIFFRWKSNEQY